jgi:DNA-binding XRE family transcriptional regulator
MYQLSQREFELKVDGMNYKTHRKELLKDKAVKREHDKLLPEFELARSIIQQRLKKKMTQIDVAKKAGMPQSTIARIEGLTHGVPRLATLRKIAHALDAELIITLKSKKTA